MLVQHAQQENIVMAIIMYPLIVLKDTSVQLVPSGQLNSRVWQGRTEIQLEQHRQVNAWLAQLVSTVLKVVVYPSIVRQLHPVRTM